MLPTKIIASALMCAASWLSTTAQVPDSVYIFSYAESGKSGLRLAVSDNGVNWTSLGDGMNFVTSVRGAVRVHPRRCIRPDSISPTVTRSGTPSGR